MKTKIKLITAAVLAVLFLLFQNCSGVSQPVVFSDSSKSIAMEGNGQGYDGKVYLVTGALCADQSHIQSQIVLKTSTSASLVRENCQAIAPVALGAGDFQINPNNPDELNYLSQTFHSQIPFAATALSLASATLSRGFMYELYYEFGTQADTLATQTISRVQLYEDGVALGPAHSVHNDIETLGLGRFSHWIDGSGEFIYFSASDNSSPVNNGRVYSFRILN